MPVDAVCTKCNRSMRVMAYEMDAPVCSSCAHNAAKQEHHDNDPVVRWYVVYANNTPVLIGYYRKSGEFQATSYNATLYKALIKLLTKVYEWHGRIIELAANEVAVEWTHPDVFMTNL